MNTEQGKEFGCTNLGRNLVELYLKQQQGEMNGEDELLESWDALITLLLDCCG